MTALTIVGNVPLVEPVAVPSQYAHATDGDTAALKAIADTFSVPAWVGPGTGTIGSQRASLSDDNIADIIIEWCRANGNWTGSDQVTSPALASSTRALEIYDWITGGTGPSTNNYSSNPALNSGKGPTVSCATLHAVFVGLVGAYGIPARRVYGETQGGNIDVSSEYWSPAKGGWVHTLAHVGRVLTFPDGTRASLYEWVMAERINGTRTGIITVTAVGPSGGTNAKSGLTADWAGYSVYNAWQKGNWENLTSNPSVGYVAVPPRKANLAWSMAHHLNDIRHTVNGVHVTFDRTGAGMIAVQLEQNMIDFSKFQWKKNAGAWTDLTSVTGAGKAAVGMLGFYPVAGDVWKFQAVGTLGNTSNIVTATAA